jgi:hypothetical protein
MKTSFFLGVLVVVVAACGKGGPSDAEITAAVQQAAEKSRGFADLTGDTWPCGAMNAPIKKVSKVEVAERGEDREGYVPVKVKISGTCMAQFPKCGASKNELCPEAPTEFTTDKPVAFRLKKDDYGKWTAEKADR